MANIRPIEDSLINDIIEEMADKFLAEKGNDEDRMYEVDKITTSNILFATLNIHFTKNFKYGATILATDFETEELSGKTMVIKSFTNDETCLGGIAMNSLPDNTITLSWILEENKFEFRIGNTSAAMIEVLGGASFSTGFNDKKFNLGNESYRTLMTIISNSITHATNVTGTPDKPGFSMDVDDTIEEFTHKFFEKIEDGEERGKQEWFMSIVWKLDEKLSNTIGRYSHWFLAEPAKGEKRFIKIFTPKDMTEFNLDLGDLPDNIVAMEFNHEVRFMRIRIGNDQVFSVEVPKDKDEPIFCGPIDEDIKKNELYDTINNIIDSVMTADGDDSDE